MWFSDDVSFSRFHHDNFFRDVMIEVRDWYGYKLFAYLCPWKRLYDHRICKTCKNRHNACLWSKCIAHIIAANEMLICQDAYYFCDSSSKHKACLQIFVIAAVNIRLVYKISVITAVNIMLVYNLKCIAHVLR